MVEISPIFNTFAPPNKVDNIASSSLKKKEEPSSSKQKAYGATVAFSLIGVAIISTLFFKGNKGALSKHLDNTRLILYKERNKRIVKESYNIIDKLVVNAQKLIDKGIKVCNSISNIMPIKDILILKLLNSSDFTKRITHRINKMFKNTAIKSCKKQYDIAFERFEQIHSYMTMLTKKTKRAKLQDTLIDAEFMYHENFLASPRNARINKIHQSVENLESRVESALYDKKTGAFNNIQRFNSYITFDLIENEKRKYHDFLLNLRRHLTVEPYHKIKEFYDYLDKIRGYINVDDIKSMNLIKEITTNINQYKMAVNINNKKMEFRIADGFVETLQKLQLHLDSYSGGYQIYNQIHKKQISDTINNLSNLLNNRKMPILQNCLQIIEEDFGKNSKEFQKSKRLVNNFSKEIDKAIAMEGIGLFEKLAEIKIGSGPNDLIGVALPAIFATYLTMKADTKEEKISTALQTSIPIIGGVAVTIYGTVRMYAGAANLALGLVSGLGLNILGTWINKTYKSYADMDKEQSA